MKQSNVISVWCTCLQSLGRFRERTTLGFELFAQAEQKRIPNSSSCSVEQLVVFSRGIHWGSSSREITLPCRDGPFYVFISHSLACNNSIAMSCSHPFLPSPHVRSQAEDQAKLPDKPSSALFLFTSQLKDKTKQKQKQKEREKGKDWKVEISWGTTALRSWSEDRKKLQRQSLTLWIFHIPSSSLIVPSQRLLSFLIFFALEPVFPIIYCLLQMNQEEADSQRCRCLCSGGSGQPEASEVRQKKALRFPGMHERKIGEPRW